MTKSTFGHIQKLGKDHYKCYWRENGRQKTKTLHCTLEEAKDFLANKRISLKGAPSNVKWGEFWQFSVVPSFSNLESKTIHEYERIWRRELSPFLENRLVSDTNARIADECIASIQKPSVQKAAKALGRKLCNMAIREGLLERNPFVGAKTKRHIERKKQPYTPSEIESWMKAIRGIKYEPILLCELGAGLRHEEACALTWEDVSEWNGKAILDISKALVTVNGKPMLKGTKTARSEREMVLGEPFSSRLLELKCSGPILKGQSGYANPNTMTHNYKSWCERHKVRYVCPKDLRSTFATLHAEAGSIDSLVSEAMGHTDGTTKGRHYQQTTRAGLALIADNLALYLSETT